MRDETVSWLWAESACVRAHVAVLLACQVASGACAVGYALLLREVVDSAVAADHAGFWAWIVAMVALTAFLLALAALVRWLQELCRARMENALKLGLFDTLMRGDVGRVASVHSGEWVSRLTSDAQVVADGVADIVPGVGGTATRLVGALAAIVWLDPRVCIALIPGGAALVALTLVFRKRLRGLHKDMQAAEGHLRAYLQDRLWAHIAVWAYAAQDHAVEGAEALACAHLDARMRRNRFWNVCNMGFGAAMSGARLGAVVWCGYGMLTGTMSFGTLTAMVQLVSQVQAPLANISGYLPRWYAMLGSADRIAEAQQIIGETEKPLSLADAVRTYDERLSAVRLANVAYSHWHAGSERVDPSKEGSVVAVEGLTLEVRKGEMLAITGRSGCGKSTALGLLMGAYEPDKGSRVLVTCDGGEKPLGTSLRRLFAYVPQGNVLMDGTIREVVSLGDPEGASEDERVWEALRLACADGFVRDLPDGLDSVLGERGAGLSEGQSQRLSVARAIFSGSPILLLDEATSALDAKTERQLLENLYGVAGRTTVVVTHRPAALELCDRQVDLGGGTDDDR